jgi:hypothetical protein
MTVRTLAQREDAEWQSRYYRDERENRPANARRHCGHNKDSQGKKNWNRREKNSAPPANLTQRNAPLLRSRDDWHAAFPPDDRPRRADDESWEDFVRVASRSRDRANDNQHAESKNDTADRFPELLRPLHT